MQALIPARRPTRLTLVVAASAILVLIVGAAVALVAPMWTAATATVTLEDGVEGCMGVRTTPGSENTTKELVGGTLEPGGTALFRFTFPATVQGNPGQEEWKITDCVFLNDEPFQKYTVTALENDISPVVIEFLLTIPADTPVGAEYCNYGKTTETPSDAQASNRKAGPACFIVGGALRIEKNDAAGAPLSDATFTVACDWPNVAEGTFLPDTIVSAPTDGDITPPGGVSTVTLNSVDDGSFTLTVVTGDEGVISVNGPVGTECTFTETAAPPGYVLPTPPDNEVTLTIDDAGQQTHEFVNELPSESPSPSPSVEESVEASVEASQSPEGSQLGGTGTPAPSVPDTAMSMANLAGPLATVAFGLILLASLGALAYANVQAVRRRS